MLASSHTTTSRQNNKAERSPGTVKKPGVSHLCRGEGSCVCVCVPQGTPGHFHESVNPKIQQMDMFPVK